MNIKNKNNVEAQSPAHGDYIRNRIKALREKKGVSEYQMSIDIGRSKGYIHNIMAGRALPSMNDFGIICKYFGISPKDFFDIEVENPSLVNQIIEESRSADDNALNAVLGVLNVLKSNQALEIVD
jgi:transcriptional regulator with XRE-family HTH domain